MESLLNAKVGDMVYPDPLWNRSEREPNRLNVPTKILEIVHGVSQTGVIFKVRLKCGSCAYLDSGWFTN